MPISIPLAKILSSPRGPDWWSSTKFSDTVRHQHPVAAHGHQAVSVRRSRVARRCRNSRAPSSTGQGRPSSALRGLRRRSAWTSAAWTSAAWTSVDRARRGRHGGCRFRHVHAGHIHRLRKSGCGTAAHTNAVQSKIGRIFTLTPRARKDTPAGQPGVRMTISSCSSCRCTGCSGSPPSVSQPQLQS